MRKQITQFDRNEIVRNTYMERKTTDDDEKK